MMSSDDGMPMQQEARSQQQGPRARRIIGVFLAVLLSLIALALLLVFWVLPWLGRRGDLNTPIENLLRSALDLPVRIGAIETDPMSRLAITHMSSIRTRPDSRFEFRSERISLLYSPWDLWSAHRVEELIVVRPRLRLDLDTDLSGIFAIPEVPEPPGRSGPVDSGAGTSFGIGHFSLQEGELRLEYGGQTFVVDGLNVDVFGLGDSDHTRFRIDARLGAAELQARGRITAERSASGERSFRIYDAGVELRNLDVSPFFGLLERFVPGLRGHGRVDLAGEVKGRWPSRVSVDLRSSLESFSAAAGETVVDRGALVLTVHADVVNEMERVDFTVQLDGEGESYGRERELQLRAEGNFRKDVDDGLLTLGESSRLVVPGLGELRIDGALRSLLTGAVLDLRASARDIDVAAVLERLPDSWTFPGREGAGGRLGLELGVRGSVEAPVVAVEWTLDGASLALAGGTVLRASLSGSVDRIEGLVGERASPLASGIAARIRGLRLAPLLASLGLPGEVYAFDGTVGAELLVPSWNLVGLPPELRVRASVDDFEASIEEGLVATEKALLSLELRIRETAKERAGTPGWLAESDLELRAPLLLLGPAEEVLEEKPARLTGSWTFSSPRPSSGEAGENARAVDARADMKLQWPSLGTVAILASSSLSLGTRLRLLPLRLDLSAAGIENERFLGTYLRDAYQERFSFLKGARFGGHSGFDLRVDVADDGVGVQGRVSSADASLHAPAVGLSAEAIRIDLPVRIPADRGEASRGSIGIGALRLGGVELRELGFPFRHDAAGYHVDPVGFELLGGKVQVDHLTVEPSGPGGAIDLSLGLDRMDLAELSQALGWPRMEGSVGADLRRVRVSGDRLDILGGLRVHAFGGEIEFRDLGVNDFTEPYFTASLGRGTIRELDLRSLGEVFHFGLISGVLEGVVEHLVFTPGHVLRFDIDVQTVKRAGVDQIIDLRAIESVQRAISGRFAGLESLFTRFHYEGFGFEAHLRGREFRLRGKYSFDGVEHLMYSRWWQFPRVRIINTRPGQTYDWKRIQENVKRVFRGSKKQPETPEPG